MLIVSLHRLESQTEGKHNTPLSPSEMSSGKGENQRNLVECLHWFLMLCCTLNFGGLRGAARISLETEAQKGP